MSAADSMMDGVVRQMTAPAPVYGPDTSPPATVLGRLGDRYPMWWLPPSLGVSVAGVELGLHATHPILGAIVLSGIAGASLAVGGASARSLNGGPVAVSGGGLLMAITSGLAAAGCAVGGTMTTATAVFGAVGGFLGLVPDWLHLHKERSEHRQRIEVERMHRQYDFAQDQLKLAGQTVDAAKHATAARGVYGEVDRIQDEIRALTDHAERLQSDDAHRSARPPLRGRVVSREDDDLLALAGPLFGISTPLYDEPETVTVEVAG